jgi:hypothetical protein
MSRRERQFSPFKRPAEQDRPFEQVVPEGMKQCSKCGAVYKRKRKVSGSCPICQGTGIRNDGKPSLRDRRNEEASPDDGAEMSPYGVDDRY